MLVHDLPLDLLLIVVSVFGLLLLKRLLLDGQRPSQPAGHPLRGGFTRGP